MSHEFTNVKLRGQHYDYDDIYNVFDTVRRHVQTEMWALSVREQLQQARKAVLAMISIGISTRLIDKDIEKELWNLHTEVNRKYRHEIMSCNRQQESVSWRKQATAYKSFLKEAHNDYRELFRAIDEVHGPIDELRAVSSLMDGPDISEASYRRIKVPNIELRDRKIYEKVRSMCAMIMVRLGDLSRWRYDASLDARQNRNSSLNPVRDYYELALILEPGSSLAYNQIGILTSSAGDMFDATYYFFRAVCVEEKAPNAGHNLKLQLQKVKVTNEADLVKVCGQDQTCYDPSIPELKSVLLQHLSGHRDTEIQLADVWEFCTEILRQSLESIRVKGHQDFMKVSFLMSVSYDWCGQYEQSSVGPSHASLGSIAPHITARFFQILVERVRVVLQQQPGDIQQEKDDDLRPLLPLLHLGMIWLNSHCLTNANEEDLVAQFSNLPRNLWGDLAICLDAIVRGFDVRSYKDLKYLLPEQEDIIGFLPLQQATLPGNHNKPRKATYTWQKARMSSAEVSCTEDDEFKARLRAIVTSGLRLVRTVSLSASMVLDRD